jgi:hypothetical protein
MAAIPVRISMNKAFYPIAIFFIPLKMATVKKREENKSHNF